MKNIVVFGASGNTGSYLVEYAQKYFNNKEYNIIAVGKRKTNYFDKFSISYYSVDITNRKAMDILPKKDIHAVIMLAGVLPAHMETYSPESYIKNNTLGALNVLEYCRQVKADRILYSQTFFDIFNSLSQDKPLDPYTERNFMYTGDHAVYVISKNAAVDLIKHYQAEYGIKGFVFRLPNIYKYSNNEYFYLDGVKKKKGLCVLIDKAIHSEPIEIWGDPNYKKDMVYIADYCQMLCKAITASCNGGIFNVGTGNPVTLEEQIKTIVEVFSPKDNPSPITYRPDKKGGFGVCMDISNAINELEYSPEYDCKKLFETYKKEMDLDRQKNNG